MIITWTKCSERMPTNDCMVIVRNINNKRYAPMRRIICSLLRNKEKYEWATYTHAAWDELNRK